MATRLTSEPQPPKEDKTVEGTENALTEHVPIASSADRNEADEHEADKADEQPTARRGLSLLTLIVSAAALALAVYVGTQVIGVLYGILAPPTPPLPPEAQNMSHTSAAYGVDTWTYSLPTEGCNVVTFYEQNGATCQIAPFQCDRGTGYRETFQVDNRMVARCSGNTSFSIFQMGWNVYITRPSEDPTTTRLELSREVIWASK